MSMNAKKWLIAATSLMLIGIIMFAAVMTVYHWDFYRLSTDHFETNTYEISEEFRKIQLNIETADILFAASSDNICRVVCYEEKKMKHSVSVQDGTLTVSSIDDREWYEHIGFSFHSPKITVYLPETEYTSIVIKASTGDVEIPNKIKIDSADISLSTGEIIVSNTICTGDIKAHSTTGDVNLANVTCRNLISTGSTGDISLKNVIAAGKFSVKRSTGNVVFDRSDSTEIYVKTSTGDVTGSLLTEKVFITETSTGTISVPKTTAGGACKIITSTGDIIFH